MQYRHLSVRQDGPLAHVTLDRPDVRNAFNAELITSLHAAFTDLGNAAGVRAIVLGGSGKLFCGGADINWMRAALELDEAANVSDALRMSDMFRAIDRCPKPVIGKIQGGALGGGVGLVAVCDIAIAANDALFGFTETKLGILPAVISPFAIAKIGVSHARALFLTGERFGCERALSIGLIHQTASVGELDVAVERVVRELLGTGPNAVSAAKALVADVASASYEESRDLTAHAIARQRITPEAQEGLRAFLERRKAGWAL